MAEKYLAVFYTAGTARLMGEICRAVVYRAGRFGLLGDK
jgi:hypothetical protein